MKPLKRSPEYAAIRKRVARPKPVDAWQANQVHYFVFELKPHANTTAHAGVSFALFSLSWDHDGPTMALIIAPEPDGGHAVVQDLRSSSAPITIDLDKKNGNAA